jgi:hypothetical protein
MISAGFIIEEVTTGPIDLYEELAYLSLWGHFLTMVSMIFMFKSAAYQITV